MSTRVVVVPNVGARSPDTPSTFGRLVDREDCEATFLSQRVELSVPDAFLAFPATCVT